MTSRIRLFGAKLMVKQIWVKWRVILVGSLYDMYVCLALLQPRLWKKAVKKEAAVVAAVSTKQPRWYAADDVKKPLSSRKSNHKQTKLRSSITPGTVLILLAGRFKGKRVVFLKQLDSGLLLVTGPFKINGVPLRRVNQVYVIGTSLKVDVSGVDVSTVDDAFFARAAVAAPKKEGDEFFKAEDEKSTLPDSKKAMQKKVDAALMKIVSKVPNLYMYLNAKFSLTKNGGCLCCG